MRRIRTMLIALALGAGLGVAVAWVGALSPRVVWEPPKLPFPKGTMPWPEPVPSWWPLPTHEQRCAGLAWDRRVLSHVFAEDDPRVQMTYRLHRPFVSMDVVRAGWPFRCMAARSRRALVNDADLSAPRNLFEYRGWARPPSFRWLEPPSHGPGRPLPLLPVWPGLIGNAVFFGAILWLLLGLARAVRDHGRRARRGLCPACRYPVGSSRCPECGADVSPEAASTRSAG